MHIYSSIYKIFKPTPFDCPLPQTFKRVPFCLEKGKKVSSIYYNNKTLIKKVKQNPILSVGKRTRIMIDYPVPVNILSYRDFGLTRTPLGMFSRWFHSIHRIGK
jgi:hypothetical protein